MILVSFLLPNIEFQYEVDASIVKLHTYLVQ